jgi:DNA polymerase I-like protein with 3'-5' exonuclease and polymerase domains
VSATNGTPGTAPAAREFLRRGFAPIPLPPRSKRAVLDDWPDLRVTEADIDRLFRSDGNIGLLNGEPSRGLVDVDKDCPEALRAAEVLLPPTGMVSGRASAPSSHSWYIVDRAPVSKEFADPLRGPKDHNVLIELRSTRSQTVVPPSVYPSEPDKGHPKSEPCVWHHHGDPARVSAEALRTAVRGIAAAALLGRYWPRGSRHDASLALAGALLRAGWPDEMAERFLRAVCAAAADEEVEDRLRAVRDTADRLRRDDEATGWPTLARLLGASGERVVVTVRGWLGVRDRRVSEVSDVGRARPVPIPPYRPFPVRVLPAVVRDYVEATSAAMNCDPSYSALPALAILGAAVGTTHMISPKRGWREPAFVFTLTVGPSGVVKSPPYRDVEDVAEDINDRLEREHEYAVADYEAELEAWEAREDRDDDGPRPQEPAKRSFIKSDVTIEALVGVLQDNPRGLLIGRDELSAWIAGFVKYSGRSGASDLPHWLQLSNAGTINYTRKSGDRREVRVRGVGVSVCGTIQPRILARVMSEEFRAAGFLARLLLAYPPRRKRVWTEAEIDEGVRGRFVELVEALFALTAGAWEGTGRPRPHLVRLTPAAKGRFVAFYNANGEAMEGATDDEAAARSKLEGYALRFALIFHCCRHQDRAKDALVGDEDMAAAVALTEWFVSEAARVYALLGESEAQREVRELYELVARLAARPGKRGRVTPRDLQQHNSRKYDAAAAEADLERLVGHGLGAWEEDEPEPGRGGHRPRYFRPAPTSDTSDTRPDEGGPEDGHGGGGGSDTRPPTGPGDCGGGGATGNDPMRNGNPAPGDPERVSEVSDVGNDRGMEGPPTGRPEHVGSECRTTGSSVGTDPVFVLVTSTAEVGLVVAAVEDSGGPVGLDTETTGLNHATDRCRLLSLATPKGTFLIDLFAVPAGALGDVFEALARVDVIGHNLGFDLPFLARLGFTPGPVGDTMVASQVLHGGDITARHTLKDVAARTLGLTLDKELQAADWSRTLTPGMLRYTALDAEVPVRAWERLAAEANAAEMSAVLDTEMSALPCVAWAAIHGVGFDRAGWESLALDAESRRDVLREQLDALAPNGGDLFGTRNWDSPEQVKEAFASVGIALDSTDDDALAAVGHPLAATLRDYRSAARLATAYGRDWLRHVEVDGRVYAAWKQVGAGSSGRMSCSGPNLQQLPRDPRYRRCFVAPPGRVLVKADYSQIELRIAAKIAGDRRMLDAYRAGEDLHVLTARSLLGKSEVSKADRQLAKAVNFGLLYGQGARGLMRYALANYGVALTEAEAGRYREKFFATYPGLRRWHRSVGDEAIDTRTLAGRLRRNVTRFTEKLNTPVQGTGADGLKRALALLWERRGECPGAFPVLFVHDEIVVEAPADVANAASEWLRRAMLDGMAPLVDPVPVEVEATVGRTWGG